MWQADEQRRGEDEAVSRWTEVWKEPPRLPRLWTIVICSRWKYVSRVVAEEAAGGGRGGAGGGDMEERVEGVHSLGGGGGGGRGLYS